MAVRDFAELRVAGFIARPIQQRQVHQAINDGHVVRPHTAIADWRFDFIHASPGADKVSLVIETLRQQFCGAQPDSAMLLVAGEFVKGDGIERVKEAEIVVGVHEVGEHLVAVVRRET